MHLRLRAATGWGPQPNLFVNTAILGAFVRATSIVELEDLLTAIEHEVPTMAKENKFAATEAYEQARFEVNV